MIYCGGGGGGGGWSHLKKPGYRGEEGDRVGGFSGEENISQVGSYALYRIISKRRYILAAQLLLREKSGT